MSGPDDDRTVQLSTGEQPVVEQPSVRTAPAPSRIQRWWASVPPHVGPARTSTVVLAVLFLALGSLYLTVRPEPAPVVAVQTTTPAPTTARTKVPVTSAPAETTTGTTTPAPTTATTTAPTSGPTTATTSATTTTGTPTSTVVPTTEVPTTAPTTTEPAAPTS